MNQPVSAKPFADARLTLRDAITLAYLYARDHGEDLLRIAAEHPTALKHASRILVRWRDFEPLNPAEHRGLRWLLRWLTAREGRGGEPIRTHRALLDEIEAAARCWLIERAIISAIAGATVKLAPGAPLAQGDR